MAKVTGRTDDMLIIRGVNVFPSQIEELILRVPGLSAHYLLELARAGYMDTLTVHVECAGEGSAAESERKRAAEELAHHVKSYIGISVKIEVHPPGVMERSVGKAKRVTDRRAGEAHDR
jgi:phenylacetate-CoA ligase